MRLSDSNIDFNNILFKLLQVELKIWTDKNFSLHVYGRLPDDHNSTYIRFSTIYVYTQALTQGVIVVTLQLPFKLMIHSYVTYQIVQQHSLCIGLAHTAPPTNTNFRITFLLTQLLEALYEDLHVQSIKFEVYRHFFCLSFIV